MKIFQVKSGMMFSHLKDYKSVEEAYKHFHKSFLIVEAPDYVFDGWGYDPSSEGDARFIKPTPPDGWLYDDETGTFYPEGEIPPSEKPDYNELLSMFSAIERGMTT